MSAGSRVAFGCKVFLYSLAEDRGILVDFF